LACKLLKFWTPVGVPIFFTIKEAAMTRLDDKIEGIYTDVLKRNPGETEFHQAVLEVLESLGPVVAKHPEYLERKIIERICEPERQIISGCLAG